MNQLSFLPNVSTLPLAILVLIAGIQLIWLWSVVTIARQKTADPFDRIVWLMIVLSLNIVGTLLYALFSPHNVLDPARYAGYARAAQQARQRRNAIQRQAQTTHKTDTPTQSTKPAEDKQPRTDADNDRSFF